MADVPATGMWVYGVTDADAPDMPPRAGVDERHGVELVRHGRLAAVASAVPFEDYRKEVLERRLGDLRELAALARAHQAVLDDALRLGPVVPLRMCTICESRGHVRWMLDRERRPLLEALRRLSGNAEWGVKAYVVARAGAQSPPQGVTRASPGSGIEYLAHRRAERDTADAAWRATEATVGEIHRSLREHALAGAVSPPQDPRLSGDEREMVLNAAYLVPDARAADFRSLVAGLARRHAPDGVAIELTGPWPAYHFAGSETAR
jgi:Gas vesicle synthesis protein GvpL/GvpF